MTKQEDHGLYDFLTSFLLLKEVSYENIVDIGNIVTFYYNLK